MCKKQELEKFYNGDNKVIAEWLIEFAPQLKKVAKGVLHESFLIEDALQDLFIGLATIPKNERISKFRPNNFNLASALTMRLKYKSIDLYRKRKHIRKNTDIDELFSVVVEETGRAERAKEAQKKLSAIIAAAKKANKLKEEDLEIIKYMLKGYQNQAIAELMNSNATTIGKKKHRLLRKLKRFAIQRLNPPTS